MKTTTEKFLHEVEDAYDAEHRFMQAMEKMSQKAAEPGLKKLVDGHIKQTQGHIQALEKVFQQLDEKPKREKCQASAGIVAEGETLLKEVETPELTDSVICAGLSKAEHYELATYKGLHNGAQAMGDKTVQQAIDKILGQEEEMVKHLETSAPRLLKRAKASQES